MSTEHKQSIPYLVVPTEILSLPDINALDALLFSAIYFLDGSDNCFASNAYLASILRVSERSVTTSLAKLIQRNLVQRVSFNGRIRVIAINRGYRELCRDALARYEAEINTELNKDLANSGGIEAPGTFMVTRDEHRNPDKKELPISLEEASSQPGRNFYYNKKSIKEESTTPFLRKGVGGNPADCRPITLRKRTVLLPGEKKDSLPKPKAVRRGPVIDQILEYWKDSGLHLPAESTKGFREGVKKIRGVLAGTLFGKKFSPIEIKRSIDNFSLSATDMDFEPIQLAAKKKLRKLSISDFIENSFMKETSFFLRYVKNEPIPSKRVQPLEDKHPRLTALLKRTFRDEVLGGVSAEFSVSDSNKFVLAAKRAKEFLAANRKKINPFFVNSDENIADALWKSVRKDCDKVSDLSPGWLCSDLTFNRRFPRYLNAEGAIQVENNQFSIYDG